MTITMGQLINGLYEGYARRYHDDELAAVATQVTLEDVLRAARRRRAARARWRRIPSLARAE